MGQWRICVIGASLLAAGTGCALIGGGNDDEAASDVAWSSEPPSRIPDPVAPASDGSCPADRKKCGESCVSVLDPAYSCAAASCAPCSSVSGSASCVAGACSPATTTPSADDSNGSNAACSTGQTACNGVCIDLATEVAHCGACGKACTAPTNGVPLCAKGACEFECQPGYRRLGATTTCAKSNTWMPVASMPIAGVAAGATALDGRLFLFKGDGTTLAYAPTTDSYVVVASRPVPTIYAGLSAATAADGRIFVFGATGSNKTVQAYTPSTNSWSIVASMPEDCSGMGAAASSGHIFSFGGTCSPSGTGPYTYDAAYAYTPSLNSWGFAARSPFPPAYATVATTALDGSIFVFPSGRGAYVYVPQANAWAIAPPRLRDRSKPGVATALDGRIFIAGGNNVVGFGGETVEVYTPSTNSWAYVANMSSVRSGPVAATAHDGRIFVFGGGGPVGGPANLQPAALSSAEAYIP